MIGPGGESAMERRRKDPFALVIAPAYSNGKSVLEGKLSHLQHLIASDLGVKKVTFGNTVIA